MAEYVADRSIKISDTTAMHHIDNGDVVVQTFPDSGPSIWVVIARADLARVAERLLNSHVWNARNVPKSPPA